MSQVDDFHDYSGAHIFYSFCRLGKEETSILAYHYFTKNVFRLTSSSLKVPKILKEEKKYYWHFGWHFVREFVGNRTR